MRARVSSSGVYPKCQAGAPKISRVCPEIAWGALKVGATRLNCGVFLLCSQRENQLPNETERIDQAGYLVVHSPIGLCRSLVLPFERTRSNTSTSLLAFWNASFVQHVSMIEPSQISSFRKVLPLAVTGSNNLSYRGRICGGSQRYHSNITEPSWPMEMRYPESSAVCMFVSRGRSVDSQKSEDLTDRSVERRQFLVAMSATITRRS